MKDPHLYDDGYLKEELSRGDAASFEEEYRSNWDNIDASRAEASLRSWYRDIANPQRQLFNAVVDGFSPVGGFKGSNGGFESSIVNPLCFTLDDPADLLLAKKTYGDVHLCFVFCEVGDENYTQWVERVNKTYEEMLTPENKQIVKSQLECADLDIGTTQYTTLARAVDLFEFDFDALRAIVRTDSYCIWRHEEDSEERSIHHHSGQVAHKKLRGLFEDPLDYARRDFTNIKYQLNGHLIFPLQEVLLQTIVERINNRNDDYPREFNDNDFLKNFRSGLGVGPVCDHREKEIRDRASNLLQVAIDLNILVDSDDDINSERDYRFRTQKRVPEDIKETVRSKFFKNRTEFERGRLAYKRTRENFEEDYYDLDDERFK